MDSQRIAHELDGMQTRFQGRVSSDPQAFALLAAELDALFDGLAPEDFKRGVQVASMWALTPGRSMGLRSAIHEAVSRRLARSEDASRSVNSIACNAMPAFIAEIPHDAPLPDHFRAGIQQPLAGN